jgi:glycosyltransferase involved in cell wall biosynthesis
MSRFLAIVPAYNEAGAIAGTVNEIRRHAPEFDVIVVDDGSTDETGRLAAAAGARVISHPFNLGIGGAVQSGYQFALEHRYDVAVQVDGDGQHDPRHIPVLLSHLRENPEINMVTGSRFLSRTGHGYRSSVSRRLGIRIFARVLSVVTRRRVTDPTSGFRMTDRRGIELFARDYPHDYPEVEAVLMVHAHRLASCELPVSMRERQAGRSSIGSTQSAYYMIKVLLAVLVGLLRARPEVAAGDDAPVAAEHAI